jgi:carbamoyltransferase
LLECFYERTGIPLVLNTSFNQAGEPIVNSPKDAIDCFLRSGLDALIMDDYLIFVRCEEELRRAEGMKHAHYGSVES